MPAPQTLLGRHSRSVRTAPGAGAVAGPFRGMTCWQNYATALLGLGLGALGGSSRRWWQQLLWLQVLSDVYDLGPALQRKLLLPKEVVSSPAGAALTVLD